MPITNVTFGTELMRLMSVEFYDLDSSVKNQKFQDIYQYFEGRNDAKWQVLKILNKRPSEDKMETVWNWVQLQQERSRILNSFDPNLFEPDINEQIKTEYLTKENIELLHKQARDREVEARMRESERKVEKTALSEEGLSEVDQVVPAEKWHDVKEGMETLQYINKKLEEYA